MRPGAHAFLGFTSFSSFSISFNGEIFVSHWWKPCGLYPLSGKELCLLVWIQTDMFIESFCFCCIIWSQSIRCFFMAEYHLTTAIVFLVIDELSEFDVGFQCYLPVCCQYIFFIDCLHAMFHPFPHNISTFLSVLLFANWFECRLARWYLKGQNVNPTPKQCYFFSQVRPICSLLVQCPLLENANKYLWWCNFNQVI